MRSTVSQTGLFTSGEVADLFNVSVTTVSRWAACGKIPALRTLGGSYRFRFADIFRLPVTGPPARPRAANRFDLNDTGEL